MNKKTISSIRISENTLQNMKKAIEKYNKNNLVNISESEFRRLSIELLSQMILQDKQLPVKIE